MSEQLSQFYPDMPQQKERSVGIVIRPNSPFGPGEQRVLKELAEPDNGQKIFWRMAQVVARLNLEQLREIMVDGIFLNTEVLDPEFKTRSIEYQRTARNEKFLFCDEVEAADKSSLFPQSVWASNGWWYRVHYFYDLENGCTFREIAPGKYEPLYPVIIVEDGYFDPSLYQRHTKADDLRIRHENWVKVNAAGAYDQHRFW
jgi:hypothetical protein